MTRTACLLALCTATFATAAFAHSGHDHGEAKGIVRERMDAMTTMGEHLLAMIRRARANKDFASVPKDARAIHDLSVKIPAQFPPGSNQHPTEAKPDIWRQWPDFTSKAKALELAIEKLLATDVRDKKAMTLQIHAVEQTCTDCHQHYRMNK